MSRRCWWGLPWHRSRTLASGGSPYVLRVLIWGVVSTAAPAPALCMVGLPLAGPHVSLGVVILEKSWRPASPSGEETGRSSGPICFSIPSTGWGKGLPLEWRVWVRH